MKFVQDNLLLILVALASGGMLLWPYLRRIGGGPSVSAAQATQLINRQDAIVLDVREPAEFGGGHIIGAKNVPLSRVESGGAEIAAKKKEKPVIVYCATGQRSARAAALLRKQGYPNAVNLAGGITAWQQAGLPVEK